MDNVLGRCFSILIFLLGGTGSLMAQPTEPYDLKKPAKFENKRLGSEKTGEKKFNAPKRALQNTITHYNWYFNANNKLNSVIERAQLAHQDDYSTLLSFYNYSLDFTQSDSLELDSVINKSTTGILIHDLRNDWIDNLFMLIGKAYYFRQDFDSAHRTFQYINYTWAPREDDGYRRRIGSNETEGGSAFQVSTPEATNFARKALSTTPSRNDALIWQIRNFISAEAYADASGLINILKQDPDFPERLQLRLDEMQALYFYQLQDADSAAYYLARALPGAGTREERSRWQYLIAQLYERSGRKEEAKTFFEQAIRSTLNPVLEVYARLGANRQHRGDSAAIEASLKGLLEMGRREKYSSYRDIIYYAAAQIELDRNNLQAAKELLLRASRAYGQRGLLNSQRSQAFLLLGDISFQEGAYSEAKRFYDSIPPGDPAITDMIAFTARQDHLSGIIQHQQVIYRQDSLQRLAAMPEADREKFLNQEIKRLRKLAGLEDESSSNPQQSRQDRNQPPDLFGAREKGDWYFHNANLKSRGYTAFKARWGNRENTDNWRRASARGQLQRTGNPQAMPGNDLLLNDPLSVSALMQGIPLSIEQMEASNDSIEEAKLRLGQIFLENLENYRMVINTLDSFPDHYPYSGRTAEAVFYLYYSYLRLGMQREAAVMLHELQEKFHGTDYERQASAAALGNPSDDARSAMNRKYDQIYNLFIEGNFRRALQEKQMADSLYGQNYWTPQLLYIESIYHIRQRDDATAIDLLQNLVSLFPESLMQEKASTLIDVLGRRREIERYLTDLEITRPEDSLILVDHSPTVLPVQQEPLLTAAKVEGIKNRDIDKPQIQTDREAGKLRQTEIKVPDQTLTDSLLTDDVIVETVPVEKTVEAPKAIADSIAEVKPVVPTAPVRTETADTLIARSDSEKPAVNKVIPAPKSQPDSAKVEPTPPVKQVYGRYTHDAAIPHSAVILMEKVDPVYVTESRNAFNRYNSQAFAGRGISSESISINDTLKMVVINGFANVSEALSYAEAVKQVAPTAIIPWMPAGRYRFLVISPENLRVLRESQQLAEYEQFQRLFIKSGL